MWKGDEKLKTCYKGFMLNKDESSIGAVWIMKIIKMKIKNILKLYILADIKRNCRNQDLYRNKDDFWFFLKIINYHFLILKIFYSVSISVKCIRCKIYDFQKKVWLSHLVS